MAHTDTAARTATVTLPAPAGAARDEFPGGASIGLGWDNSGELLVWIDRARSGSLTASEARELAAALLAGADAADAENGKLHGDIAHAELVAWNSTIPDLTLTELRAQRLRVGDRVASLDGHFGPDAVNLGTVSEVDSAADRVVVTAPWLPDSVEYDLDAAGRNLYLAEVRAA